MRDSVRAAFYAFNAPMEGEVPYFYQDVKGLVSIGVGLLCDPIALAMGLPMVHPDGRMAQRDEIAAEWLRIKNLPPNAKGQTAAQLGHLYARPHTRLRLTQEGLEQSLQGKLNQADVYLTKRFPEYPEWPADAQLGVLSMAWACGPAFRFPRLEAALKERNFRVAAFECFMPEEKTIGGLRPRNRANRILFNNAATVQHMLDPNVLCYPRDLDAETADPDEPTQPAPYRADTLPAPFDIVHPLSYEAPPDDEPPPEAA